MIYISNYSPQETNKNLSSFNHTKFFSINSHTMLLIFKRNSFEYTLLLTPISLIAIQPLSYILTLLLSKYNMQIDLINDKQLIHYFLVFCRASGIILTLPGAHYIPARIKILLLLFLSIAITPIIENYFNNISYSLKIIFIILQETIIGLFIGCTINIIFSSINMGANIIATQIGLSSVINFDQSIGEQNVILGNFFILLTITCMFTMNYHLMIINLIIISYDILNAISTDDFSIVIIQVIKESFNIAIKISSLLFIIGTLSYLVVCLLGRVIPQVQFFFIAMPLQIWIGFFLITIVLYSSINWYINFSKSTGNFINVINNILYF